MNIQKAIGYRIVGLREMNGITQQQLADFLGITRQSLSLYERGERSINAELLLKIADYFNVSTDYLLGRTPNQTADTDLQGVLDFTGLSEKAVDIIISEDNATVFNKLLETDSFSNVLQNLSKCYNGLDKEQTDDDFNNQENIEFMVWRISQLFMDCVSEFTLKRAVQNL